MHCIVEFDAIISFVKLTCNLALQRLFRKRLHRADYNNGINDDFIRFCNNSGALN